MSKFFVSSLCFAVLLIAGCGSKKTDTTTLTPLASGATTHEALNEVLPSTEDRVGTIVESEDDIVGTGDSTNDLAAVSANPGIYVEGNASHIDTLSNEGKKVVLFFHADRCPTCQALDQDIKLNASKIPSDIAIVKLNYDKEEELKLKYSIKNQNTIVYLDKSKNPIASKSGGIVALDEVVKNIP